MSHSHSNFLSDIFIHSVASEDNFEEFGSGSGKNKLLDNYLMVEDNKNPCYLVFDLYILFLGYGLWIFFYGPDRLIGT